MPIIMLMESIYSRNSIPENEEKEVSALDLITGCHSHAHLIRCHVILLCSIQRWRNCLGEEEVEPRESNGKFGKGASRMVVSGNFCF